MGRSIVFQKERVKWGAIKAIALVAALYGFYKIVTDYLDSPDLVLGATAFIVGVFVLFYPFRIEKKQGK